MANNVKVMDSIRNFLLKMKAMDEEIPEELAEDALEMTEEVKDALEELEGTEDGCETEDEDIVEEETEDEEPVDLEKKVEDALTKVLRKHGYIKDSAMESLDELEEEMEDEDVVEKESEAENTTDPEVINAQDSARKLLRKVKPVIASVKDSRTRKMLSDSFAQALKLNTKTADYASIYEVSKKTAMDSAMKNTGPSNNLGDEWAKKYNPHYKEVK